MGWCTSGLAVIVALILWELQVVELPSIFCDPVVLGEESVRWHMISYCFSFTNIVISPVRIYRADLTIIHCKGFFGLGNAFPMVIVAFPLTFPHIDIMLIFFQVIVSIFYWMLYWFIPSIFSIIWRVHVYLRLLLGISKEFLYPLPLTFYFCRPLLPQPFNFR